MVPASPSGPGDGDLGIFAAGGEAGRLMAAMDWSTTPVGPVESWPASLRYAVRTVLVSRFPMVLTWGPEFTQFYNDGYAPLIGAQHPAIGDDIRETLSAAWDALGPPIAHAMTTLESSWFPALQLLLERHGYREETYFTVTHAPAFGDDGTVAGMHAVCYEVTGQVIGSRRQRLLHELAAAGGHVSDEAETVAAMCRALAEDRLDVPFAAVYLAGDDAQLRRVAARRLRRRPAPGGDRDRRRRGRSPGSTGWASRAARGAIPSPTRSSCRWASARAASRSACSSSARARTWRSTRSTAPSTS